MRKTIFLLLPFLLSNNLEKTKIVESADFLPSTKEDFKENECTSNNLVLSYNEVADFYLKKCIEKNSEIGKSVNVESFIDCFRMQDKNILDFSLHFTSYYSKYMEELANARNEQNYPLKAGSISIISPDEDYILNGIPSNENYTNSNYFERAPLYNSFDYSTICEGDIIYESAATFPNHAAYIFSPSHSSSYGNYVQTIEAVASGVNYGFLDDDRMVRFGVCVYRIYRAIELGIVTSASSFIYDQLGKPYSFDFLSTSLNRNETSWYCSELIYAGYSSGGLDICSNRNFDFDPYTMACLPVYLTQGRITYSAILTRQFLEFEIVDFVSKFVWNNSYWKIRIYNPNSNNVSVSYNTKMCFVDDAQNWQGLNDISSFNLGSNAFREVNIYQNGFASAIVASYTLTAGNSTTRFVSYGKNLSKTNFSINTSYAIIN